MNLDFQSPAACGLRRYVRLVTAMLGPAVTCTAVHWNHPANAYVALSGRLRWFPARDVALNWDGRDGWAMVLVTPAGATLTVLRYFGQDVLPTPRQVALFSGRLFRDEFAGQAEPPRGVDCDLMTRLAGYAVVGQAHQRRVGQQVHLYGVITARSGPA